MKISVVIPCYGSEKTIESVVEEIIRTCDPRGEPYWRRWAMFMWLCWAG